MSQVLNRVFVYGTLKEGMSNDRPFYAKNRTLVQVGTISGTLFDLGSFPGISLAGDTIIHGEVHTYPVELMKEVLERMDSLEGYHSGSPDKENFYNRRVVDIILKDGEKVPAYLYEFNTYRSRYSLPIISSGIWKPRQEYLRKMA